MSHMQGKCKCGHDLHVFKFNWLIFIAGLLAGIYIIGIPYGQYKQSKNYEAQAPNYYKDVTGKGNDNEG